MRIFELDGRVYDRCMPYPGVGTSRIDTGSPKRWKRPAQMSGKHNMEIKRRVEVLEQRRRLRAAWLTLLLWNVLVCVKEWKRLCKEFDDGTYMAQRGLRIAFEERLKMTNTSKAVKGNIVREHRAMT